MHFSSRQNVREVTQSVWISTVIVLIFCTGAWQKHKNVQVVTLSKSSSVKSLSFCRISCSRALTRCWQLLSESLSLSSSPFMLALFTICTRIGVSSPSRASKPCSQRENHDLWFVSATSLMHSANQIYNSVTNTMTSQKLGWLFPWMENITEYTVLNAVWNTYQLKVTNNFSAVLRGALVLIKIKI